MITSKSAVPGDHATVANGDLITYTIWVTNVGNIPAPNVPISDSIPAGTIYVVGSAVPPQNSGPDPLVWILPSVLPGVPYSVSFTVLVAGAIGQGAFVNVAYVGGSPVTSTNEVVHVFAPTAIQLASLQARRGLDQDGYPIVTVTWVVLGETNTLGYRVYRSGTPDRGSATAATDGIVAATGVGGTYTFVDSVAALGQTWYYWVQEVEVNGNTHEYGPAAVAAGLPEMIRTFLPNLFK
ncbi:MAG: DUF11 domain-containing protein [Thermoflexales bacterium]